MSLYHYKNAIIYRTNQLATQLIDLEEKLSQNAFTPREKVEFSSTGWVTPIEELPHLSPAFHSNHIVNLQVESAVLPADTIARKVAKKVKAIEEQEGRKVRKKERDGIKEDIVLSLLPTALSKYSNTRALLDPLNNLIIVEASSHNRAEDLLSMLRESLGSLEARPLQPVVIPSLVMTNWLSGKETMPEHFSLGYSCELHDQEREQSSIKVKEQDLRSDEIRAHLNAGMVVSKLELSWYDQYEFELHEDLSLHKIVALESDVEPEDDDEKDALQVIEADVFKLSAEMSRLANDLIAEFGGEQERLREAS